MCPIGCCQWANRRPTYTCPGKLPPAKAISLDIQLLFVVLMRRTIETSAHTPRAYSLAGRGGARVAFRKNDKSYSNIKKCRKMDGSVGAQENHKEDDFIGLPCAHWSWIEISAGAQQSK
uniref:Uncharacterized protein n=1 Tax=Fopius arisanus TaxID=64838 RepID=A0A0C9R7V3_9HYME